MAARKRVGTKKVPWDESVRERIQTSMLINRLNSFVNGNVEMNSAQVTAALGLLRKVLPDLQASENKTEVTHRYVARIPGELPKEEWQSQHSHPKTIQ